MIHRFAGILFAFCAALFAGATALMFFKVEPFHTYYFLFAWWCAIGAAESALYRATGESRLLSQPADFFFFLVPCSAFVWFVFEAFNLRLANWAYAGVPGFLPARWLGYFFAFGTVLPGVFAAADILERFGIFRRNEFSRFFSQGISARAQICAMISGSAMLVLPLLGPRFFFPLVWGGFTLLLDPVNARWGRHSLLQDWSQNNWNRTLQLLLAGFICGGLWEFWNFWAGAKWVYTVPLPDWLLRNWKIFEMPALGFLGFPPFALECFVLAEFARGLRDKLPRWAWRLCCAAGFVFMLFMCRFIDARSVRSFH